MDLPLFRHNRPDRPVTFKEYCDEGGFEGLKKGIPRMSPAEVQQTVIESGLRGRGGAGFPTGKKWSFVPRDLPGPRWLICNCDEMEPGTYKDRVLLESNPYSLIEGMTLASYALGVRHAFIFIRKGYEKAAQNLSRAIDEAKEAGYLGERVLGSESSIDIDLHLSAGRYICGEETALINALEGKRPNPRQKPPFPAVKGLWNGPTVVNNVETLANVGAIIANGAAWYKGLALNPEGAGTKLFCVSGAVAKRVCVELPIGTTLREVIEKQCGGMRGTKKFKACIPGGASTQFLTEKHLDVQLDYEAVAKAGSRLGSGGIIVFEEGTCLVAATLNMMNFFARESCGWCTPCREGLPFVKEILQRIEAGGGEERDFTILREHIKYLNYSFCALAPGAMAPLEGLLNHFEDEVREHMVQKGCPFR